jgi:hypothetical protein
MLKYLFLPSYKNLIIVSINNYGIKQIPVRYFKQEDYDIQIHLYLKFLLQISTQALNILIMLLVIILIKYKLIQCVMFFLST